MAFGVKPKILSQIKHNDCPMRLGDYAFINTIAIERCLQWLIYQISRSIGIVFIVPFGFRIWQCGRVLLSERGRMPLPFLYHR